MPRTTLTREERQQFFRDGYIVIKNAVPVDISQNAREVIAAKLPKNERRLLAPPELATHESILSLFNDTCLAEIMRDVMGPFPDVISSQVAVTPPRDTLGDKPRPHVDGSWSGAIPDRADEIDLTRGRPIDAIRYFGENDERRGTNDGQLWQDPDKTISLGSYTALVGVALNDQRQPGNGQFAVLKCVHEEVEAAFRMQRDTGGPIGPEGPGWPRIKTTQEGGTFLNGLPASVRETARQAEKDAVPIDGWPWPELTPVLLDQGDAVIALHSCPHTATPNYGPDARMNVYFRIRRLREGSPHEGSRRLGHGVSDHLDRGYYGRFLEYPSSYDPWKTSVDKLCDHWSDWDGMQEIVAAARR
ncbi:MAG: hypothetical protein O7C67_06405 [Gammaproteobacteria bacterium]|nr:hypothetical protein [Gammaproteobacteria bacterium]